MKGLHHVLVVVEHLVRFVKLLLSTILLESLLFGINSPSLDLVVFELFDSLVFFPLSFSVDGVWPLGDSGLGDHFLVKSFVLSHGLVVLHLVSLRAHALDSLQLLVGHNGSIFGGQSSVLLILVSFTLNTGDARSGS